MTPFVKTVLTACVVAAGILQAVPADGFLREILAGIIIASVTVWLSYLVTQRAAKEQVAQELGRYKQASEEQSKDIAEIKEDIRTARQDFTDFLQGRYNRRRPS